MRAILCLFALIALLNYAAALNCFACVASLTSDCFNGDTSSMVVVDCAAAQGSTFNTTIPGRNLQETGNDPIILIKCISFIQRAFGMTFIERGCGYIWENVDICEYIEDSMDLLGCSSCDTDLCNFDVL